MAHIENFWINAAITNPDNRKNCCGCTACASICGKDAIVMQADEEGFLYPWINEKKCVDCGLCVKVCPITNKCEDNSHYIKAYGGYSTNERIINSCASGGIATALSIATIEKGGVVFGVQFNKEYDAAEYAKVDNIDDLWNLCSSKYVQPNKSGIYADVRAELQTGKAVLFVGCPCDVAGLKRFLRKGYENLLTCELFCAGVTTNKVLKDYRTYRECKVGSKLMAFNVRNKEKGWFVQHIKEEYENGKIFYKNHFGTYLGHGFLTFRRPSCYSCQYKQNTTLCDIKVGDFWGIKDTDPFWNPKGVSVILAKAQKGMEALQSLKEFNLYEINHTKATINNHGFMTLPGSDLELRREKFGRIYIEEGKGLEAACKATAPLGFWIKHYVPSSLHSMMKKLYHAIIDKK